MAVGGGVRRAAPWVVVLLLPGCMAKPVPRTHFYRLDASATSHATMASPRLKGVLVIERFRADGLTGDRPILYSEGSALELDQHHYHYWVEPPTDILQEQMAAYLRGRNVATTVVTPELRIQPDYVVTGRIIRFERVLGDGREHVVVEARLTLMDVAAERLVWADTYRIEKPVEGRGVRAAVEAFNQGVGEMLARFADDIARP